MSRFLSNRHSALIPYVPGEQPKDMKYIKLNTNESPFAPSESVKSAVMGTVDNLKLYSDPECTKLVNKLAEIYNVEQNQVITTNGSDEALNFAFMAFADEKNPIVFPDITYGFYPIFAKLNHIPYEEIPLRDDFSINADDYIGIHKTIVIANPNAPSGLYLSLEEIEKILSSNPDNVVIIDEAYIDFGSQSAVSLVDKYDNLLVIQTFSKSRSMAGARLGFCIGNKSLIADLNTIKYSTNPYNVNAMTMAAGYAALCENDYYMQNCKTIIENREYTEDKLKNLGFTLTDSKTNFVFAKSDKIDGEKLYLALKERGILVRHFKNERICQYNRITIGTKEQMDAFLKAVEDILKEI